MHSMTTLVNRACRGGLTAITCLQLGACASSPDPSRLARVEPESIAADPGQSVKCAELRQHASPQDTHVVLASYSYGGSANLRMRQWVVVPASRHVHVGDAIRLLPGVCRTS